MGKQWIYKRIIRSATLICALFSFAELTAAQNFDLVILNGRVMDPETKYDAVANVGVKDGRIAVITEDKITAKETIDATGLVVAPGFIDGHQHCIEPYAYRLMLRDGRTTIMDLELGAYGPKLDEWYKRREGKAPVNFGVAVSHEFARAAVLDGFKDWKYFYTPDAYPFPCQTGLVKDQTNPGAGQPDPCRLLMKAYSREDLESALPLDTCEKEYRPAKYSNCKS